MRLSRRADDARLDAIIHDSVLRAAGVIEPDEPTAVSHALWLDRWRERSEGEFAAEERRAIRAHLGLGPFSGPTSEGEA